MTKNDRRWWVMVGVGMASFIGCIDFTIVNTALPTMQKVLGLSFTQLQWVMNIFMFMFPVFLIFGGRCGDIYGHRKVLYTTVIIFGLASLGAGLSSSLVPLLIFRAIQGVSCAMFFPNAAAVVLNAFPREEQGKAMGVLYSIYGIGLAIGPVVGGLLIGFFTWRWIFYVNVPIIIVSLIICLLSVKESLGVGKEKLDYVGSAMMIIGMGGITTAIAEGNNWGWTSPIVISLFVIGILVSILWCRHELHTEFPTFNFRLFNNPNIIASLVGAMVLGAFYSLGFFLMPLYLDNILHYTPLWTGTMLMATSLMVAMLSPIMGRLMDKYSVKYLILSGLLLFVVSAVKAK